MQAEGRDIYHLAFGQSPFPIPECFTKELMNFAHKNDYLPVAGKLSTMQKYIITESPSKKKWRDVISILKHMTISKTFSFSLLWKLPPQSSCHELLNSVFKHISFECNQILLKIAKASYFDDGKDQSGTKYLLNLGGASGKLRP